MNNEEQYNFFNIGENYANDTITKIRIKAEEIEKKFGFQAREEFEEGIVNTLYQYQETKHPIKK